ARFLVGDTLSLADVALLAYTRLAHECGFHLGGYAAIRRWIGEAERSLGLPPGALKSWPDRHGTDLLGHHPSRAPRRRRRHCRDAGGRRARQRPRTDRRPVAAILLPGVRGARARPEYSARGGA